MPATKLSPLVRDGAHLRTVGQTSRRLGAARPPVAKRRASVQDVAPQTEKANRSRGRDAKPWGSLRSSPGCRSLQPCPKEVAVSVCHDWARCLFPLPPGLGRGQGCSLCRTAASVAAPRLRRLKPLLMPAACSRCAVRTGHPQGRLREREEVPEVLQGRSAAPLPEDAWLFWLVHAWRRRSP